MTGTVVPGVGLHTSPPKRPGVGLLGDARPRPGHVRAQPLIPSVDEIPMSKVVEEFASDEDRSEPLDSWWTAAF